ncbi:M42 family metallopeptidase [Sporosalibacterium faouarense]|uniref:M42 family metallopeptidase n=1 Tax=Sporosalibacterium faouarense TaxID=516123 RepID=UPI00141D4344|nr:M42 family metallopeptidase [Sporosalibacterium faouarense]MTI48143.1 M42 family metallopeptidase [Bacillota bacterium]
MEAKEFLKKLCDGVGVSGYEETIRGPIIEEFKDLTNEIETDRLGNIIAVKHGENNKKNIKIMLAAHMDEIGLMVKDIDDDGFIRFTTVGGFDPRTLLAQEVMIHGTESIFGVIGAKPPHLTSPGEREKAIKIEDLTIDVGFTKEEIEKIVQIGDVITLNRQLIDLQGSMVSGKALDDRAGVVTMCECAKELAKLKHEADVYFVSTVQEEVGVRGATTSTYKINPDIGIAIDVGFGATPELPSEHSIEMSKGAGIAIGGNIHPTLREKLTDVAKEYNIDFQYEISPGPTGTDARAMQITRSGIPTLLLSLPLRYMHTSVETIDMKDIKTSAQMLARFIASITNENLEGLLCY